MFIQIGLIIVEHLVLKPSSLSQFKLSKIGLPLTYEPNDCLSSLAHVKHPPDCHQHAIFTSLRIPLFYLRMLQGLPIIFSTKSNLPRMAGVQALSSTQASPCSLPTVILNCSFAQHWNFTSAAAPAQKALFLFLTWPELDSLHSQHLDYYTTIFIYLVNIKSQFLPRIFWFIPTL